jgi:hypothetical protein
MSDEEDYDLYDRDTIMIRLKITQSVCYRYISNFTNNEHLRITFAFFGLFFDNRDLSPDELLDKFPHKNKLEKYNI